MYRPRRWRSIIAGVGILYMVFSPAPDICGARMIDQEPSGVSRPMEEPLSKADRKAPGGVSPVNPAHQEKAPPSAEDPPMEAEIEELRQRHLQLPVADVRPEALHDTFNEKRGAQRHEALDIAAPRGAPVLAVEDGTVVRLFLSKPGGLTVYQFDPTRTYAYYYAHLDRYAEGLREQDCVGRGQVIGYVGTSGNAPPDAPHLHFAIFKLTEAKRWWEGTPINPYLVFAQESR